MKNPGESRLDSNSSDNSDQENQDKTLENEIPVDVAKAASFMTCPVCGFSEDEVGAVYCSSCGADLYNEKEKTVQGDPSVITDKKAGEATEEKIENVKAPEEEKKVGEKPSNQEIVKETIVKETKEAKIEDTNKETGEQGVESAANIKKEAPEGSGDSISKSKFKPGTVRIPKPEDPIFNKKNIIFVGVILALFLIFILVFRPRPPASVYNYQNFKSAFYPISGGGADDNKAEKKINGKISLTHKVEGLQEKGCLKFDYENEVDQYIGVGTIKPVLNNFKEISLRIRSKNPRIFAIGIEEMSGVDYLYSFPVKADKWIEVTVTPGDFVLSSSESDPNGKFDLDNLNNRLVIADLSGQRGEIGKNIFWIEKVEIKK
ncbi:MAG: hypothetical protein K8T10_06580 [Candidatus Eremiobacteraeota bacterium]|nr:hypothetical protein [Candidatus Eremiobacteraeota bacterium]